MPKFSSKIIETDVNLSSKPLQIEVEIEVKLNSKPASIRGRNQHQIEFETGVKSRSFSIFGVTAAVVLPGPRHSGVGRKNYSIFEKCYMAVRNYF